MTAIADAAWLERPLAAAFLGFNLLPAGLLHPTRKDARTESAEEQSPDRVADSAGAQEPSRIQRHASASILQSHAQSERFAEGFEDPALPVFMAPPELFERLVLQCGLVVLAPAIRRIIARDELQALRAEFPAESLDFSREQANRLWTPDGTEVIALNLGNTQEQASRLGFELLYCASRQATPPVAWRACLRLPDAMDPLVFQLPPSLRQAGRALSFARAIMQGLDPEWLALFPASR